MQTGKWNHDKNNHLSTPSIPFCTFRKWDMLSKFFFLIVCFWSAPVRTDVCTADFKITLSPPPPGEVWLCHSRSLQTSAASIRALLTLPPSFGCSSEPFVKRCFYTWVSTSINSNTITLSPSLLSCPVSLAFCSFFFGKLILLMWSECHEVSPSRLDFLAWPSRFFFLYPISSCQPRLSTIQDACPCSICLCLSYSVNPAFFPRFHQFRTLWY